MPKQDPYTTAMNALQSYARTKVDEHKEEWTRNLLKQWWFGVVANGLCDRFSIDGGKTVCMSELLITPNPPDMPEQAQQSQQSQQPENNKWTLKYLNELVTPENQLIFDLLTPQQRQILRTTPTKRGDQNLYEILDQIFVVDEGTGKIKECTTERAFHMCRLIIDEMRKLVGKRPTGGGSPGNVEQEVARMRKAAEERAAAARAQAKAADTNKPTSI